MTELHALPDLIAESFACERKAKTLQPLTLVASAPKPTYCRHPSEKEAPPVDEIRRRGRRPDDEPPDAT
jgi:hypothetical protein